MAFDRNKPERKPISNTAAQAIYDKLAEQDKILDQALSEIMQASAIIASETATAHQAYATRTAIAQELGELAAEDFSPFTPPAAVAPANPSRRFYRRSPFPGWPFRDKASGGKSRFDADEELI